MEENENKVFGVPQTRYLLNFIKKSRSAIFQLLGFVSS